MANWGVTPSGFSSKSLATIETEVDDGLKSILGESAGTNADGTIPAESAAGQLKTFLVDIIAAQWDLMQSVYSSFDPNQATDASQDALCALTGTIRSAAQFSVATGICVGDPLTELSSGRVVSVEETGARFVTSTGLTIAALSGWSPSVSYLVGDMRTNNEQVFRCFTAGLASTVAPSGTSSDITDGAVHWRFLGEGSGAVTGLFTAEEVGPVGALAHALTEIETPVSGWNAVDNSADAVAGEFQETNAALRARRDAELASAGNTTVDTIRANILKVNEGSTDPNHEQPDAVFVFFNDTDTTDVNGLPPHSIEVLVQGGTAADIVQEIWDSVGAGTATFGSSSGTATDSEGNSQTVYYTRPTEVPIWIIAIARYSQAEWPASSETTVGEAALSALLTSTVDFPLGRDVRSTPLAAGMLRGGYALTASGSAQIPAPDGSPVVPGLLEIDPLYIGIATGPSAGTQITIGAREIATFDSSRCTITATTEDP